MFFIIKSAWIDWIADQRLTIRVMTLHMNQYKCQSPLYECRDIVLFGNNYSELKIIAKAYSEG